jgi:peptide chain release factor 1
VLGTVHADLRPYLLRGEQDYLVEWYSGSGAGGQHRNKHQNSARVTHLPTGLVRSAQTRSRDNSLRAALGALNDELDRLAGKTADRAENAVRRGQVGSGQRSDKRRTIRYQDGLVHDHITGKKLPIARYMSGGLDALWP